RSCWPGQVGARWLRNSRRHQHKSTRANECSITTGREINAIGRVDDIEALRWGVGGNCRDGTLRQRGACYARRYVGSRRQWRCKTFEPQSGITFDRIEITTDILLGKGWAIWRVELPIVEIANR